MSQTQTAQHPLSGLQFRQILDLVDDLVAKGKKSQEIREKIETTFHLCFNDTQWHNFFEGLKRSGAGKR
jgi:hypothetical protein